MSADETLSGIARAAYRASPIAVQQAVCSLASWRSNRQTNGGSFARMANDVSERAMWTTEQVDAWRRERLQRFVGLAATAPFWADRFRRAGLRAEDVTDVEDLSPLPPLSKRDVAAARNALIPPTLSKGLISRETGGTTGACLKVPCTLDAFREQRAVWWRYRLSHGIEVGTWCARMGVRYEVVPPRQDKPPFWRRNPAGHQIFFSMEHLDLDTVDSYVAELRRRQLPWLEGYPSSLARLASLILDRQLDLGYRIHFVTLVGEALYRHQAEAMVEAFGVKPLQHYGMTEAVANASQCEQGMLHMDEDFAAVEIAEHPASGASRMTGTNFTNPAFPLLRYQLDDLVEPSEAPCGCGRSGRSLRRVAGRIDDFVTDGKGGRIRMLDRLFVDQHGIREAQIVQDRPGQVAIVVSKRCDFSPDDERGLLGRARELLGPDMEVTVAYLNRLPRTIDGKLRLVVRAP